ncbi:hypothetical protein, partial [Corynebacterium diphtheriae]|uniref:hypothetical protein n=1 Tax=Corynebacterium diphtheriae TaxID=1717 RepID=UPI001A7EF51B
MLVVIVIFPRQGMMATFDRANHLFFCQLQAMLCCLWWFLPVGWTRSSLKGWLMHFLCLTDFFMESLILAQDERWR